MLRILFFLLLFITVIVSTVAGGAYWVYKNKLHMPIALSEDVHHMVEPNSTLRAVAMNLMDKKILNYPTALLWVNLARWEKKANKIKAGEYLINVGITPQQLLDKMIAGKTVKYKLTIPEGWNFKQILAAIRKHPKLVQTLNDTDNASIMAKLGYPNEHPEGRFYPDTYIFTSKTTDVTLLKRAYKVMQTKLEAAWKKRDDNLPLKTPYEALILASLIEKETAVAEERPLIGGVFTRRLKKGMLLQTDPTVIYALSEAYDGKIYKRDLRIDSPYNTYRYKGLPPTPIAMPGIAAIEAALNPSEGNALYFVAKGDKGYHHFSSNLKQHDCAVIKYLLTKQSPSYRRWCRKRPTCEACRS